MPTGSRRKLSFGNVALRPSDRTDNNSEGRFCCLGCTISRRIAPQYSKDAIYRVCTQKKKNLMVVRLLAVNYMQTKCGIAYYCIADVFYRVITSTLQYSSG